jgi:hypothetical protein
MREGRARASASPKVSFRLALLLINMRVLLIVKRKKDKLKIVW